MKAAPAAGRAGRPSQEKEGILCYPGSDAGLAQNVGQSDDGHQGGFLQQDHPKVRQAGQGDAYQLRQDHKAHCGDPAESDGIGALVLTTRDSAESGRKDFGGKCRENHAEGEHAGDEAVDLDCRLGAESFAASWMPIWAP